MNGKPDDWVPTVTIRDLGQRDYIPLWREMQEFTDTRDESTADEIWFTSIHDGIERERGTLAGARRYSCRAN